MKCDPPTLGERGMPLRVWSAAVLTLVVLAGLAPRPARAQRPARLQEPVTAFVNVSVIPMDQERVLKGQTVVVQGDRVVAMGPVKQVRVPATAVRVDGRGKFLMPGLADMHMHVGPTGPRHAERILFLLLANGVTTIRNVDYLDGKIDMQMVLGAINSIELMTGPELLQLRARLAAGELAGPRMYTSGQWYTDTSKSVAENVAAYKAAGYDFIKVHDEWEPIDSLIAAARRIGMPIMGHPVRGLEFALQHRFASVEHFIGFLGERGTADSMVQVGTAKMPAVVAATRQAGTWVVPTLAWSGPGRIRDPHDYRGNRYLPPETQQSMMYAGRDTIPVNAIPTSEQPAMQLAGRTLRALQAAGVGLLVGTDSPLIPPGYGVHQELEALVRVGGLTPYEALVAGTRNVAAYFGTLDSAGTVAVGKRADLVLLTANPLVTIRNTERIAGVMAGGRWWSQADLQRRLDAFVAADAAAPLATALMGRWRSPAFTERTQAGTRTDAKGIVTDSFAAHTTFLFRPDSTWLLSTTFRARLDAPRPDTVIHHGGAWRRSGDTLWLAEDSTWAKTALAYTPDGKAVRGDTVKARPAPRITAWKPYQVTLHNQRLSIRRLGATDPAAAGEPFVCGPGAAHPMVDSDRLVCPGVYERQRASTP